MQLPAGRSLAEELLDAGLHPAPLGQRALKLEDRAPAHSFTTVVAEFPDGLGYVTVTARDFFDEGLAEAVLSFVENAKSTLDLAKACQVLTGFRHPPYGFDAVMVLGPEAHGRFRLRSERLHSLTWEVFPIFRCEFSGNEPPDIIELVRQRFVSTLDWKREVAPRAQLRFNNTGTGCRSTGRAPGLAKASLLAAQLRELTDAPGSFVEVWNYLGEQSRVTVVGEKFVVAVAGSGQQLVIERDQLEVWMRMFLVSGLRPGEGSAQRPRALECPVPGTRAGLFLTDYPRERTIPSIQPLETSGERILEEFSWLSDTKGCFLGVVRGDGETLQFMWDEGHTLEVDVPSPALQGSFKTTGSYEECRCLLASFLTGADVTSAPGLVFTLWK